MSHFHPHLDSSSFPASSPFTHIPHPSIPTHQPLNLTSFSSILTHPLSWLWPQRIPTGKLSLLEAAPGAGATLFSLFLASTLSTGSPWPDGSPSAQCNVLLLCPTDSPHDTLKPRLEAAGADLSHLFFLSAATSPSLPSSAATSSPGSLTLPDDLALLETAIRQHDIRLLILDSLTAFPGLRRCLPELTQLAQRTSCAILLTTTLPRSPANPLHYHGSSSLLHRTVRSHLLLLADPTDERRFLLLTPHHPLCAAPSILSYDIRLTSTAIPLLHWLGHHDLTHLARLCTAPLRSPHRLAILRFLHASPTAHPVKDILHATSLDYHAGRKMLTRMASCGELLSPARGLYTTPDHPCLASFPPPPPKTPPSSSATLPNPSPRPAVPTVPCPNPSSSTPSPGNNTTPSHHTIPTEPITLPTPPAPHAQPTSFPPSPIFPSLDVSLNHIVPTVPPIPPTLDDDPFPSAIIPQPPPSWGDLSDRF